MNANPILVERYRGEVLESFHTGVVCIVDKNGEIIFSLGDINQVCFPRSALKFFQVIPLLESGAVKEFNFNLEEIALMCGSHNGETRHLKVVDSILRKIGLSQKNLKCGAQYPTLTVDKNEMIKSGLQPRDIHNNCSGKHAGFLAMCVYAGYSIEDYLENTHPLHQEIKRITAEMHEYPESKLVTAIDGCSAPIFALPVFNQAIGYKNLVNPESFSEKRQLACKIIIEAVSTYPYMIAGKGRYCTELLEQFGDRLIGKTGADGVYSLGFRKELWGGSIKIDDGLMGPQYAVAQEIISRLDIGSPDKLKSLEHYINEPVFNWAKHKTGHISVNKSAFKLLNRKIRLELY
jgi:L-asparaginase II